MTVHWLEEVNRKLFRCDTEEGAIEIVKKLYIQGMPPAKIIKLLGMWTTAPTMVKMLRKEGIKIKAVGGLNKITINITEEQYINMSFMAIGKLYNVTGPTIRKNIEANPNKYKHLVRKVRKKPKMRWSDNG